MPKMSALDNAFRLASRRHQRRRYFVWSFVAVAYTTTALIVAIIGSHNSSEPPRTTALPLGESFVTQFAAYEVNPASNLAEVKP